MFNNKTCYFISLLLCIICFTNYSNAAKTGPNHGKVVVCYFLNWYVYRDGRGSHTVENIDPTLCTHIVYAFVVLNESIDAIEAKEKWQDLTDNYGKAGFRRVISLKEKYPHLKITVGLGGWNDGSTKYSKLVADPVRRRRFVQNAVEFVRKYKFDGLEISWQYPAERGGTDDDKPNFLLLIKELRFAFNKYHLILTASISARRDTIAIAYDVRNLSYYLDYVYLLGRDFNGPWFRRTGANAPLRSTDVNNIEFAIKYMLELGMDPSKLVLGLPLYGHTFILTENSLNTNRYSPKLGSETKEENFKGPYSNEEGYMEYHEICAELENTPGWKKYWDEESQSPFAINNDKVIAYDDRKSLSIKTAFAIEKQLAGILVYSVAGDDFHADCSSSSNTYPLLRSINESIVETLRQIEPIKPKEVCIKF